MEECAKHIAALPPRPGRRVLDLWRGRRYAEFCRMLPEYSVKCNGEGMMADTHCCSACSAGTNMAAARCPYFPSSGSGQISVEFHLDGSSVAGGVGSAVPLCHRNDILYGRRAMKSISTRAPFASPVTPMQVRAGRLLGGKYDA